jgi:DNA-3-methyladenine glycosylase
VAGHPFPRERLAQATLEAARALLGARLVRDGDPARDATAGTAGTVRRVGRIVEIEAYIGASDLASHARMGRTRRNAPMFGPPGHAYVYLVYGMYHCLNVVTEPAGTPAALLVRALEPVAGTEAMRAALDRSRERSGAGARRRPPADGDRDRATYRRRTPPDVRLAAGPGLLAAAFDIDRTCDGLDLCDPAAPLRLEAAPDGEPAPAIVTTPRIGIAYAGEPWITVPWRFLVAGSPSISGPRRSR